MKKGISNKMIAKCLGVITKTVAFHISAIFERLNVESRHEAVVWHQNYFPRNLE